MTNKSKATRNERRRRAALAKRGLYTAGDVGLLIEQQREGLKREDFCMRFISCLLRDGKSFDVDGKTVLGIEAEALKTYVKVEFAQKGEVLYAFLAGQPVAERPPPSSPDEIALSLSHADRAISADQVATWSPEEQRLAEDWACSAHLAKTDATVPVPPEPECVQRAVPLRGAGPLTLEKAIDGLLP